MGGVAAGGGSVCVESHFMHTTISVKMLVIIFEVLRNSDCLSAPQTDPEPAQAYVVWLPHLTTLFLTPLPPIPSLTVSFANSTVRRSQRPKLTQNATCAA